MQDNRGVSIFHGFPGVLSFSCLWWEVACYHTLDRLPPLSCLTSSLNLPDKQLAFKRLCQSASGTTLSCSSRCLASLLCFLKRADSMLYPTLFSLTYSCCSHETAANKSTVSSALLSPRPVIHQSSVFDSQNTWFTWVFGPHTHLLPGLTITLSSSLAVCSPSP